MSIEKDVFRLACHAFARYFPPQLSLFDKSLPQKNSQRVIHSIRFPAARQDMRSCHAVLGGDMDAPQLHRNQTRVQFDFSGSYLRLSSSWRLCFMLLLDSSTSTSCSSFEARTRAILYRSRAVSSAADNSDIVFTYFSAWYPSARDAMRHWASQRGSSSSG